MAGGAGVRRPVDNTTVAVVALRTVVFVVTNVVRVITGIGVGAGVAGGGVACTHSNGALA